ncbi:MAG: hypothetical protein LBL33_03260 [Tannerella sp.]|jgi:hypothetical protein|nr:hypothetical protein [Tannerella sp.]
MNPEKLIGCLIECGKKSVSKDFNLKSIERKNNELIYTINGTSSAVNRFDIPQESVKVLKWFDVFWLFLKIKFITEKREIKGKIVTNKIIRISLSVFQGQDDENEKFQLFRAEWDDNNNPDEKHAQPHWHITSSQAIENSFYKYSDTFEQQEFIDLLESEKQKVFDVKKIHFAMNGQWQNGNNHIHKIENEQQIVNWLQGMLFHIRTELGIS